MGRIRSLIDECNMKPSKIGLIVNRAPGGKLNQGTLEEIENQHLDLLGVIPQDDSVYEFDCDGKPIIQLPADSPVRKALYSVLDKMSL